MSNSVGASPLTLAQATEHLTRNLELETKKALPNHRKLRLNGQERSKLITIQQETQAQYNTVKAINASLTKLAQALLKKENIKKGQVIKTTLISLN